jgi:hypothetical protein
MSIPRRLARPAVAAVVLTAVGAWSGPASLVSWPAAVLVAYLLATLALVTGLRSQRFAVQRKGKTVTRARTAGSAGGSHRARRRIAY